MHHMRYYIVVVLLIAVVLFGTHEAQSASAVATGVTPDGKVKWGVAGGGKATEQQVKSRALGVCMAAGAMNPRIVASTSRRGFTVIMVYQRADGKSGFTCSVGAATQQDAIREASQKAKAAGARKARVFRTYIDSPETVINF